MEYNCRMILRRTGLGKEVFLVSATRVTSHFGGQTFQIFSHVAMSSQRAGSDAMVKRMGMAMAWTSMSPGHKQYFLTYLAQGLGRVGKEYLKTSAAAVLVNMRQMQIFSSLACFRTGQGFNIAD